MGDLQINMGIAVDGGQAVAQVQVLQKQVEETKSGLEKLSGVLGDLKGGFAGLKGVMELFGAESEAVESALNKVKSALEVTEEIEHVQKIGEAFKNFGSVLSDVASKGFGAIKTAIVETGIGALVIGITLLISKLIDWISGAEEAKAAQEKLESSVDNLNKALKQNQIELENAAKLAVAKAKSVGASEDEIFRIQQDYANKNKELIAGKLRDEYKALEDAKQLRDGNKDSIEKYQKALQDYNNTYNEYNKADTDIKVAEYNRKAELRQDAISQEKEDEAKRTQERNKRINDEKQQAQDNYQDEVNRLKNEEAIEIAKKKLEGGSEEDIFNIQQTYRERNIKAMREYSANLNNIKGVDQKTVIDANQQIVNATYQLTESTLNEQQRRQDRATEIQKQENEKLQKLAEDDSVAKLKIIQDGGEALIKHELEVETIRINNLEISQKEKDKLIKQYQERTDIAIQQVQDKLEKEKIKKQKEYNKEFSDDFDKSGTDKHTVQLNAELNNLKKWYDERSKIVKGNSELEAKLEKDFSDKKRAIAKEEFDYKLGLTSDLLNQAADLLGKNTAAGKTAAIASATINTYLGATKALATLPPPFSFIQAALTVATGIKNIQTIINTKVPGNDSGNSAPSVDASSPAAPLTPTPVQTSTSLNQDQINQIGNAAASRVYVLDSDIQNNRERDARLNRAARLGG